MYHGLAISSNFKLVADHDIVLFLNRSRQSKALIASSSREGTTDKSQLTAKHICYEVKVSMQLFKESTIETVIFFNFFFIIYFLCRFDIN